MESAAAAKETLSCGTGDRVETGWTYLDAALALPDRIQSEKENFFYEIVAVDGK